MSDKKLHLVRGLPGAGRTTLANLIASPAGQVIAGEDLLPLAVSPLSPLGAAQSDALSVTATAEAASREIPVIVVERTFARAYTLRPFARLAARNGYDLQIHTPHTDWANDWKACLERTNKPVSAPEMERTWRQWEEIDDVQTLMAVRSPSERLVDIKKLLADAEILRGPDQIPSPGYLDKLAYLSDNYPSELSHLNGIGWFDSQNRRRVNREYALLIAQQQLGAPLDPTAPVATVFSLHDEILRQIEADATARQASQDGPSVSIA
jgi:hypothetical protein